MKVVTTYSDSIFWKGNHGVTEDHDVVSDFVWTTASKGSAVVDVANEEFPSIVEFEIHPRLEFVVEVTRLSVFIPPADFLTISDCLRMSIELRQSFSAFLVMGVDLFLGFGTEVPKRIRGFRALSFSVPDSPDGFVLDLENIPLFFRERKLRKFEGLVPPTPRKIDIDPVRHGYALDFPDAITC